MKIKSNKPNFYQVLLYLFAAALISCGPKLPEEVKLPNPFNLTTENQLQDSLYHQKIEDFYNSGEEGHFNGQNDVSIYYKIFDQKDRDKVVLISSGRTEAAIKYKELIFDLYRNGYAVYIQDHRGQGLSGRMVADEQMGHIDNFQFYIDDMKSFFNNYLKPKGYKNKFLIAHSMGGAIGMTYIQQFPEDFNAAAFSSPMLGLKPPICKLANILAKEEPKYAIGQTTYKDDKNHFKGNTLTGSNMRYDRMIEAYEQEPKAKLGGVSYNWLQASCQQFDVMLNNISKIEIPFIVFSAKDEKIVNPKAHDKFTKAAKSLSKEVTLFKIDDARHELLIEKDQPRLETLNQILNFFEGF